MTFDGARATCLSVRRRSAIAILIVSLAVPVTRAALAQTVAADAASEARARFRRGIEFFRDQDFGAALAEFLRSFEISHRPNTLFNIGATYRALHRYPDAIDALQQFVADPSTRTSAHRPAAETALREINELVARILVRVTPTGAVVRIDDRALASAASSDGATPQIVGPGSHRVEAALDGYVSAHMDVVIASGESRTVELELRPIEPPTPPVAVAPTPPVPTVPRREIGFIDLVGAPATAMVGVDSALPVVNRSLEVEHGVHTIAIESPGMQAWRGRVEVVADRRRILRVSLAPMGGGLAPRVFWSVFALSAASASLALVSGLVTVQANAEFASHFRDDPELDAIVGRGRTFAIVADLSSIVAIAGGVATLVVGTRVEWVRRASTATLAFAPGRAAFVGTF